MKKQASTLLPALLDLLRQYLALDMAVYAGHATLLLLTASLPLLMWVLVIINMLPFYSVSDIAALVAQLLPDVPAIQSMAVDVIANLNNQSTTFMASFAAITTVISASGGMAAVQKGLQKLTPGARKTMFDRLWAVLYTFLFEGLMLVAMVVQSLSPILRGLAGLLPLHTLVGGLLQRLHSLLSISAVLSLALSLLTVTLIYTYVPGGAGYGQIGLFQNCAAREKRQGHEPVYRQPAAGHHDFAHHHHGQQNQPGRCAPKLLRGQPGSGCYP